MKLKNISILSASYILMQLALSPTLEARGGFIEGGDFFLDDRGGLIESADIALDYLAFDDNSTTLKQNIGKLNNTIEGRALLIEIAARSLGNFQANKEMYIAYAKLKDKMAPYSEDEAAADKEIKMLMEKTTNGRDAFHKAINEIHRQEGSDYLVHDLPPVSKTEDIGVDRKTSLQAMSSVYTRSYARTLMALANAEHTKAKADLENYKGALTKGADLIEAQYALQKALKKHAHNQSQKRKD